MGVPSPVKPTVPLYKTQALANLSPSNPVTFNVWAFSIEIFVEDARRTKAALLLKTRSDSDDLGSKANFS